ncbi:hypothetical protein IIC65_09665 [Candidatus Sumerlaeota bacterium]|nr:hypothetical protein [Candidatus Sumerlaeota bacterium]
MTGIVCLVWGDGAVSAQERDSLDWSVTTPRASYYPGEAVRLDFAMSNTGDTDVDVDFGYDGIGAFSFELLDSAGVTVASGPKIQRGGFSGVVRMNIAPGQSATRKIVLNQWISTRLPDGEYVLQCLVEPTEEVVLARVLGSESRKVTVVEIRNLEPASLELRFSISTDARTEALRALDETAGQAQTRPRTQADIAVLLVAREMIAYAEMEEAVPYQLQLFLKLQNSRTRRALLNNLIQAKSAEAASGLVEIIENAHPNGMIAGIRSRAIEAVYKLRDTGKADILQATDAFVATHARPPAILSRTVILD